MFKILILFEINNLYIFLNQILFYFYSPNKIGFISFPSFIYS